MHCTYFATWLTDCMLLPHPLTHLVSLRLYETEAHMYAGRVSHWLCGYDGWCNGTQTFIWSCSTSHHYSNFISFSFCMYVLYTLGIKSCLLPLKCVIVYLACVCVAVQVKISSSKWDWIQSCMTSTSVSIITIFILHLCEYVCEK